MVWVYEDPPYTSKEIRAYRSLKRKLKDKKFVDSLIKLISLYSYLKKAKLKTVEDIQKSAFFDKAHTRPIFDENTAKKLLRVLSMKGGESKYPYLNTLVKGTLRDYTPGIIGEPVSNIYGGITGVVDTLKSNIPFADLGLSALHGATEIGVTAAGDVGEGVGGPVGAAVVAPFAAIAAALASGVSTLEGDLGQSVAHLANAVPIIGSFLGKLLTRGEHIVDDLKNHETLSAFIPYATEYHQSLQKAGKRLSTMKQRHTKWNRKTMRHRK